MVATLLLDKRVEVNPRDEEGRTPLATAIARGKEAVTLFMEQNARGCVT